MAMMYADKTQSRFFLIPSDDAEQLPAGSLEIASMTGTRRQVDETAVARFELPEAEAKKHVGEKMGALQPLLAEISASMARLVSDPAAVTAPEGRFMTLLGALGVSFEELQQNTAGAVAKLREKMLGMDTDKLKSFVAK